MNADPGGSGSGSTTLIETEANEDSKSTGTNERGPSLIGSLGSSC